ncbi:MAG: flagellar brake protein [Betaproteobacteria bacterium]
MEHSTHLPDEEQHVIHNLKEIAQILTALCKGKEMLSMSFNDNKEVCLTTIIAVDMKNHAVHLDVGIDDAFNSRLLASHHVIFSKNDGIRIKWVSAHVSEITLADGKAIKIALPQKLIRMQRRDFFRLTTPIINPVPCVIPVHDKANPGKEDVLELTLMDVSLGGICVLASAPLNPLMVIGEHFDGCKISFPDIGVTSLTLQVRNIRSFTLMDGTQKYHIGLQFIQPSRGNEGMINRYTFNLERAALAAASEL